MINVPSRMLRNAWVPSAPMANLNESVDILGPNSAGEAIHVKDTFVSVLLESLRAQWLLADSTVYVPAWNVFPWVSKLNIDRHPIKRKSGSGGRRHGCKNKRTNYWSHSFLLIHKTPRISLYSDFRANLIHTDDMLRWQRQKHQRTSLPLRKGSPASNVFNSPTLTRRFTDNLPRQ